MNANHRREHPDHGAFQVKDLTCLLAIIGLLASVQFASLAGNRASSLADHCRANLRRLAQACLMYSDDNNGAVVPNYGHTGGWQPTWAAGWMDFSANFDNINTDYLVSPESSNGGSGLLGPYLQRDASIFRCPADVSSVQIFNRSYNRVRSYSMNNWMGGNAYCGASSFREYRRQADISLPSRRWVMAEELAVSINDSLLLVRMDDEYIVDYPGSNHSGGTWLNYVDGHVEFQRWQDPRTLPTLRASELIPLNVPSPGNPDMARLRQRTTELR